MTYQTVLEKTKNIKFQGQEFQTINYTYDDIVGGLFNQSMLDNKLKGLEIVLKIDSHYKRSDSEIIVSINGQEETLVRFGNRETFYKEQLRVAREFIKFYKLDLNVKWVLMNF